VESVSALLPFLLILAAFYFLIIRPARTRQRAAMSLQERLAPGLEVMTGSGIYGRVVAVEDDRVSLEVSPGVAIRVAKAAVARILDEGRDEPAEPDRPADDSAQ